MMVPVGAMRMGVMAVGIIIVSMVVEAEGGGDGGRHRHSCSSRGGKMVVVRAVRRPKVGTKDKPPHRGSEGKGGRTQLA